MRKYLLFLTLLALVVSSCDLKDEYVVEKSATYEINGEYFVNLDMQDETGVWEVDPYGIGFFKIVFTNTSANDADYVWLDDPDGWAVKAKIKCNPTTGTFEPGTFNANFTTEFLAPEDTAEFHESYPIEFKAVGVDRNAIIDSIMVSGYAYTINVIGGSIEKNAVETDSKAVTDAISLELEFGDDPGTIYRYNGYRRTGFLEDEH
jgi:hypothetical protein